MNATSGSEIQLEHGEFTRIHNTILERLAITRLSGSEFRCLLLLLRKTYGYGKKEDRIGLTQWATGTGIKRQNVWLVLQELKAKRIIYMVDNGPKRAQTWGFNKYFEQWIDSDSEQSVMVEHDSSVMPEHDSLEPTKSQSVMVEHDKTVMDVHDNKRKKESIRTSANAGPTQQPSAKAREPTAHQQYFAKVCEIVGWDYRTLTKDQTGQVAQTVGVLKEAEYTIEELNRFGPDVWAKDWRWQKKKERPSLSLLRSEIGKLRSNDFVDGSLPSAPNGKVEFSVAGML